MKNGQYELVKAPDNFPGKKYRGLYCYEHTLVWWLANKTIPLHKECLHHKNHNKRDNRIANLRMRTISTHSSGHAKPKTMIQLVCAYCNNKFEREARAARSKITSGQKDFYCNRSCMAYHFGRGRKKHSEVAQMKKRKLKVSRKKRYLEKIHRQLTAIGFTLENKFEVQGVNYRFYINTHGLGLHIEFGEAKDVMGVECHPD